jgi:hypothetical protein
MIHYDEINPSSFPLNQQFSISSSLDVVFVIDRQIHFFPRIIQNVQKAVYERTSSDGTVRIWDIFFLLDSRKLRYR